MLAFAVAALLIAAGPATAAPRPRVAVLDLRATQGVATGTATVLTSIVVSDASRAGFEVISQADITTLLGVEKQKQMLGCSEEASCLAEIGGALGADLVLSGQVGQIGSRYHLALQLLDAKKGRVLARSAQFCERSEDALAGAAQGSLSELIATARLPLSPRADAQRSATPAPAPKASGPRWRPSRLLAWSTLGAGVLVAAGGGVSFAMASARADELKDGWQRLDYATFYDQKKREIGNFNTIGYAAVGTGAAVAALGGWFLYRSREPSISLAPDLGPGHAGLVAVGRF